MKQRTLALFFVVASSLFPPFGATARAFSPAFELATILVSAVGADGQSSAARLAELIDEPLELVSSESARESHVACELARARRSANAVIFDGEARLVHVVRARDCMVLTRSIDGGDSTPYTAAFVAAELLSLAAQLERAPEAERPTARTKVALAGGIDVALNGPHRASPRVLLAAGVAWSRPDRVAGLDVALAAGIHAQTERETSRGSLEARYTDLVLRVGPSLPTGRFVWVAFAQLGVALTTTDLAATSDKRRAALNVGAGLGGRVRLVGPLQLFFQGVGSGSVPRRDYLVDGVSELREPPLTVSLELGLSVYLHSR